MNPQQQLAVDHSDGPLLIIAGAGSGKTRVLTERLVKIVSTKKARAEETLTVTFTNKAANEIKERVLHRLVESGLPTSSIPWMGTFHSICVKILRREAHHLGLDNSFSIYDTDDQLSVVKQALEVLKIPTKSISPKSALAGISGAKNELMNPKTYEQYCHGYYQERVAEVYTVYQNILQGNQALDFDDLIMRTVELFEQNPAVLAKYQQQFKYILVDEYQDTNQAQYKLVRLLAEAHNNICVVGDDDQSIYSWRGANIRNILEFEQDFTDVTVIKLEQNYRSTQKILAAGNAISAGLSRRKDKKLWTENPEGENITLYEALDEKDESYWLVEKAAGLIETGVDPEDIVVLYRMNAQSRVIEEACLKVALSYRIVGNVRFYDRKEVKDMLAYLRLVYNPADAVSLGRIINVPSRKIGAKTLLDLKQKSQQAQMSPVEYILAQQNLLTGGLRKFADLVAALNIIAQQKNVVDLLEFVLEHSGYKDMLSDDTEENRQRLENIRELVSVASKYRQMQPKESLQVFLEEVALVEAQVSDIGEDNKRITLMTAHSAKGLEYGYVFVVGMEEGLFPHSRSLLNSAEIDEERRLAYVAITRAKKKLFLSFAGTRTVFGSRQTSVQSRFLNDIDSNILDYETYGNNWRDSDGEVWKLENDSPEVPQFNVNVNDRVQHQFFGRGRVVSIDHSTVAVDFAGYGLKELDTEFANLVKL